MLTVDLARLSRDGRVRIHEEIPADHPVFAGGEWSLGDPLRVDLTASEAGSGEVVVRGRVEGTIRQECRRCLAPIERELVEELTMVFAPVGELDEGEAGEVRHLDARATELDLVEPVRQELILSVPRFTVCDPECRGLCPVCGVDWNVEECECTLEQADPRWDALRALKSE